MVQRAAPLQSGATHKGFSMQGPTIFLQRVALAETQNWGSVKESENAGNRKMKIRTKENRPSNHTALIADLNIFLMLGRSTMLA